MSWMHVLVKLEETKVNVQQRQQAVAATVGAPEHVGPQQAPRPRRQQLEQVPVVVVVVV